MLANVAAPSSNNLDPRIKGLPMISVIHTSLLLVFGSFLCLFRPGFWTFTTFFQLQAQLPLE